MGASARGHAVPKSRHLPGRCMLPSPPRLQMPEHSARLQSGLGRAVRIGHNCRIPLTDSTFSLLASLVHPPPARFRCTRCPAKSSCLHDAEHHHTRRVFITVPGVERGEVQIFESGSQAIRQVLLNRIRCARLYGKADAGTKRRSTTSPRTSGLG